MKVKKLHAKFWRYDGNHHAGRDCERYDPHAFGLDLISYVAYCFDNNQFRDSKLNMADIEVTHSKGDSFGHEVKVAATQDVWEAASLDYLKYQEMVAV